MAYSGYSGYDADSVKRQRALAEALYQRSQQDRGQPVRSWTQGAAKLADALFARQAGERADQMESDYAAGQKKLADAMLGQMFPDAANVNAPLDLRPDAVAQTNAALQATAPTAKIGAQVRDIANLTGDPLTAAKFGLDRQQTELANARYEQERQDKLNKPIVANPGDRGFIPDPNNPGKYQEVFSTPALPGSGPRGGVQSTEITRDGYILKTFRDGTQEISKDESGKPYVARDSLFNVDVGGVPFVGSRYQGGLAPITTPETIGGNKAAIASIESTQKAKTEAKIELPQAVTNTNYSLGVMDELAKHPGFAKRYGWEGLPGNVGLMEPGSPGADAQALIDQVTGQAFLSGIQALKGTGPLSEREGTAATNAVTRLKNHMQSPEAAAAALQELQLHTANLLLLARVRAGAAIDPSQLTPEQLDLVQEMLETQQ